jgi:SHS2 domain-containing protein
VGAPRFRTLAHTADLRIAVWGTDEEGLIRNAIAAAVTVVLGRAPDLPARRWVALRRWPSDLPSRLVRGVNEALFRLYARNEVAVGFEGPAGRARIALATMPPAWHPQTEVKAATYHDLRPRRRAGRLAACLTLDV